MATRTLPSRKVKVDARERLEDEQSNKKQMSSDDSAIPKPSRLVPKRRSKSVEPFSLPKKKMAMKETTLEEVKTVLPAKKGRVASAKAVKKTSEDDKAGGKAPAKLVDSKKKPIASVEGPAVKKGRATKTVTVTSAPAEKGSDASEDDDDNQDEVKSAPAPQPKIQVTNGKSKTKLAQPAKEPIIKKARGTKASAAKVSTDTQEEKVLEEKEEPKVPVTIAKPLASPDQAPAAKKGRARKVVAQAKLSSSESENEKPEKEASPPSKTSKTLMNNATTDYEKIEFGIDQKFNMKITTWNVAGLRALVQKNSDYFAQEDADIICLNELKCGSEKDVPAEAKLEGYKAFWNIGKGLGGVAILSKVEPISVAYDLPGFEDEKRMITAEFEKFYLVSTYVVNSGRGLKTLDKRLQWNEAFDEYIKSLDEKKPVIIAGDMNVSHQEIDLANPKTNKKSAGFTQEERDGFTKLLSLGFVDTFRHLYKDKTDAYTFWSYLGKARSKNVGWRLDYFVVSERFTKHVNDNVIRSSVMGSDHCPIVLFLDL